MEVEYPNIQIITRDSDVMFWGDGLTKFTPSVMGEFYTNGYRYRGYAKKYIPIRDNKTAIFMLSSCNENTDNPKLSLDGSVSFLNEKKISKIYFYIDDVFRRSLSPNEDYLNYYCEELIINEIINRCDIRDYEIYHCEKMDNNHTGLELFDNTKYLDLFLLEFINNDLYNVIKKPNKNYTKKISCISNRYEHHRYLITTLLLNEKDVLLKFNDTDSLEGIWDRLKKYINRFDLKNKEKILKNSNSITSIFGENKHFLTGQQQHNKESLMLTQSGFVNLITETTFIVPCQYISEKSLKPINSYRPFIMLGPVGNLALLKDMGFKTFDNWWDESYDKETDHVKRIEMVYEVAKFILSKSYDEINTIYDEMQSILVHNKKQVKKLPEYFLETSGQKLKNTHLRKFI